MKLEIFQNIYADLMQNIRLVIQEELEKLKNIISQPKDEELFYSLEDVAGILGISPKTMYSLNRRREITYSKQANKCYYSKKDILDFIARGRIKSKHDIELEASNSLLNIRKKP